MLLGRAKKAQIAKGNRVLITINVLGSAGPMRFVVYEEELVAAVINTALKSYARAGRLPVLALMSPWEAIGANGSRNFVLCKKPPAVKETAAPAADGLGGDSGSTTWPLLGKKGSFVHL